jgi:tetratricopeptide (TPR) repeat protein
LGQAEEAARSAAGVVDAELARIERARAAGTSAEDFDLRMDGLEAALNAANFDQARGLLEGCAALYERFYDDAERRARAEDAVKHGWVKLPLQVRIELIQGLAETDLRRGDATRALALLDEAQALFAGARWLLEDQIRIHAGLIAARHRAGDCARARREAEGLLAVYNERRAEIVNIERAGALRALAAAHAAMGQGPAAMECLRRAAEEGMENPNARPRANDLVATCIALATLDLEPDARFAARLREICAALRDPW